MEIRPSTLARSTAIGNAATDEFCRLMRRDGWTVRAASENQDIHCHIDYFATRDGKTASFDVKGNKAGSASMILVELKNVLGRAGWAFGKADYFSFATENGFLHVPRAALFQLLKKMFGFEVSFKGGFSLRHNLRRTSTKFLPAPFYYARDDRPHEMVVFVPVEQIRALAVTI